MVLRFFNYIFIQISLTSMIYHQHIKRK